MPRFSRAEYGTWNNSVLVATLVERDEEIARLNTAIENFARATQDIFGNIPLVRQMLETIGKE